MKIAIAFVAGILLAASSGFAKRRKPAVPCQVQFSLVWEDPLKNISQGFSSKWAKWYEKKIEKKYPDVCYAAPAPDVPVVFFIAVTPAVYHGTSVDTEQTTHDNPVSGTITDEDGNTSNIEGTETTTSSSSVAVPYTIHYGVYTLTVQTEEGPGKWKVRHRFQQGGLYRTLSGIPLGGKGHHPAKAVIEEAAKWIHEGGLTNPLETVVPQ